MGLSAVHVNQVSQEMELHAEILTSALRTPVHATRTLTALIVMVLTAAPVRKDLMEMEEAVKTSTSAP